VGIELLDAMEKVSVDSFLNYEIEAESIGDSPLQRAEAYQYLTKKVCQLEQELCYRRSVISYLLSDLAIK